MLNEVMVCTTSVHFNIMLCTIVLIMTQTRISNIAYDSYLYISSSLWILMLHIKYVLFLYTGHALTSPIVFKCHKLCGIGINCHCGKLS